MNHKLKLTTIDKVDKISPEVFKKEYLEKGRPLIIENYAENWLALEKWNIEFFKTYYGNIPAKVHGKWQTNNFSAIQMSHVKVCPFGEFLEMLEKNEFGAYKLFLFDLIQKAPELRSDFDFPTITNNYVKKYPMLFFGLSGSDVRLHYDIDLSNIFLTQFLGTKRITLFDKSQSQFLYKVPFTTHSAVDIKNLDFNKFPELKNAQGYQCDLKPNETLFMPTGMWHHIEYLDASFSLSLRTLSPDIRIVSKGIFNFFILRYFDNFMHLISDKKWSTFKMNSALKNRRKINS